MSSEDFSDSEQYYDSNEGEYYSSDSELNQDDNESPCDSNSNKDTEKTQSTVLTSSEIVKYMIDTIKEVSDVINIPTTTTRVLLSHFKWDKDILLDKFYDGDLEKLCKDANIINPFLQTGTVDTESLDEESCEICYCDYKSSELTGLPCGHKFCRECWNEYLATQIMSSGMGESISCAAHDCPILVDDQTCLSLLSNSKAREVYQKIIAKTFIECNLLFTWCSSPDCTNAIKVEFAEMKPVTCSCGTTFCFMCGRNWHNPIKCGLLKKWLKICEKDQETSKWLLENTKECPKCQTVIEKSGGCNAMTCTNDQCKYIFCWVCLGSWAEHKDFHLCFQYETESTKAARKEQERNRSDLNRYVFYYNGYINHRNSSELKEKLESVVTLRMSKYEKQGLSWIDINFLEKSLQILWDCRQTLSNTYILAFYLCKNNEAVLLEENQNALHRATEELTQYLEIKVAEENFDDVKKHLQNLCRFCSDLRKTLENHVHEGYDKRLWKFTEEM